MKQSQALVVAAKDEVFDKLFRQTALIAKLAKGSAAEAEYEAMDASINRQIVEVGRGLFPHEFTDKHIFVSDDWWPDHTRHVDVSIDGFTQAYYDGLRTVLAAAPPGWRVQAVVYGDIMDGKTMIGSAAIWADRVVVDRALYGLLVWRKFDLRCGTTPIWRETIAG
jgi:hypothetical protein